MESRTIEMVSAKDVRCLMYDYDGRWIKKRGGGQDTMK